SQATSIVASPDGGLTFLGSSPADRPLSDPWPNGVIDPLGAGGGASTFMGQDLGGGQGDNTQRVFLAGTRPNEQHMRWSVGFQRELPGQWVFEAAYVGNHGYDLTLKTPDTTNLRDYID